MAVIFLETMENEKENIELKEKLKLLPYKRMELRSLIMDELRVRVIDYFEVLDSLKGSPLYAKMYLDSFKDALTQVLPKMSEENNNFSGEIPQFVFTIVNNLQDNKEIENNNEDE